MLQGWQAQEATPSEGPHCDPASYLQSHDQPALICAWRATCVGAPPGWAPARTWMVRRLGLAPQVPPMADGEKMASLRHVTHRPWTLNTVPEPQLLVVSTGGPAKL